MANDKNVAPKQANKNAQAQKSKPEAIDIIECKSSLDDLIFDLEDSLNDAMVDVGEMVEKALVQLKANNSHAAQKLLEGTLAYIDQFLAAVEEDEDVEDDEKD